MTITENQARGHPAQILSGMNAMMMSSGDQLA